MSRRGKLLIATPCMAGMFARTVILIFKDAKKEGTLGVCLNRPSDSLLADVWAEIHNEEREEATNIVLSQKEPLYSGGPVYGPISTLHTHKKWGEEKVVDGIFWSAESENLVEVIKAGNSSSYRFFSGYAGWSPGQLDDEIQNGGWVCLPGKKEYVFMKDPCASALYEKDLWRITLSAWSHKNLAELGIKHIPDDPRVN